MAETDDTNRDSTSRIMSYAEMKKLHAEDVEIYNRTGSVFYLTRSKLLEAAIADAIRNRHSDCTDI